MVIRVLLSIKCYFLVVRFCFSFLFRLYRNRKILMKKIESYKFFKLFCLFRFFLIFLEIDLTHNHLILPFYVNQKKVLDGFNKSEIKV